MSKERPSWQDFKELSPEFYTLPEFLNKFKDGKRDSVSNVELGQWANENPSAEEHLRERFQARSDIW